MRHFDFSRNMINVSNIYPSGTTGDKYTVNSHGDLG